MGQTKARRHFDRLRKLVDDAGPGPHTAGVAARIEAIQGVLEYEPALDALAWYVGAAGVNEEESAMASRSAIEKFKQAEDVMRDQAGQPAG